MPQHQERTYGDDDDRAAAEGFCRAQGVLEKGQGPEVLLGLAVRCRGGPEKARRRGARTGSEASARYEVRGSSARPLCSCTWSYARPTPTHCDDAVVAVKKREDSRLKRCDAAEDQRLSRPTAVLQSR